MENTPYIKCPKCGNNYLPTSKCSCEMQQEYMPGDLRQVRNSQILKNEVTLGWEQEFEDKFINRKYHYATGYLNPNDPIVLKLKNFIKKIIEKK